METEKKISDSVIDMVELVLPNDVNLLNNLKGGTLMHWIDIAAALTASKHSNHIVATVAMVKLPLIPSTAVTLPPELNPQTSSTGFLLSESTPFAWIV